MKRLLAGSLSLVLLVSCQDSRSGGLAPISGSPLAISEARFGGNPDFFFSSPLATPPQPGDANFDVGASHSALRPFVRICETDGSAGPAGCLQDVTLEMTGSATGLAMTYGASAELYQANWQTKQLVVGTRYRIEVWGISFATPAERAAQDARWLFGWQDIDNSPSVSSCTGAEQFCLINYGQTIPVKVRIEQFIFCPVTRDCAMQFVAAGVNANLEAKLDPASGAPSAQLFIPGQANTDFAIAFLPCSAQENAALSNAIDLPTFGPCLKTLTSFQGALILPAIVSLCDELDAESFGLTHNQEHQLSLHHFTNDLARVTALPEAYSCGAPTSGEVASREPNGLLRLASAASSKVAAWLSPRPLFAAAKRIDRGGGGSTTFVSSYFKLALPAKFEYEFAADASQTGLAGSNFVLRAKVTDLFGDAVANARVRWTVASSPAPGASVQSTTPVLTDALGIAQAAVQLSTSSGFNVFHASGRGIASSGTDDCTAPTPSTGSCNGPRATLDPFLPIHMPEFDALGTELPIDIAEGTRLPFTVFGCTPGFGSATVDGNFSSSEWACATTHSFTANVSGGSTPATLYVMNDGSKLYLAVRLARSSTDKVNTLQFNFDNNNSWTTNGTGASETGDDVLSLSSPSSLTDAYMTLKCTNSSQSSCWGTDASGGGTNDGTGSVRNDGAVTTYELSHPLNTSDDTHDFSLAAGSRVGLFLTLQTGAGAAGNTQWPGFRMYQEITIRP
ncbi:MAG: hypothetical protein ACRENU_01610 [Gemmatimonadaceae bacterium]